MEMDRRTYLKTTGAATGAVLGGTGVTTLESQEGEAIVPAVVAAAAATSIAWLIRDHDPLGIWSDDNLDLARDERIQSIREKWMRQQNAVDQEIRGVRNIINYAYNDWIARGKIDAVEGFVAGDSTSEIKNHAHDYVDSRVTVSQKNLDNRHDEMCRTVTGTIQQMIDHPDIDAAKHLVDSTTLSEDDIEGIRIPEPGTQTLTLADGSELSSTVSTIEISRYGYYENLVTSSVTGIQPGDRYWSGEGMVFRPSSIDDAGDVQMSDATYTIMRPGVWSGIWSELENTRSQVHLDLDSWVDMAVDQIQDGMSPVELLSPGEISMMLSESESDPSTVADMIALDLPVDENVEYRMNIDGMEVWGVVFLPGGGTISKGDVFHTSIDDPLFAALDVTTLTGSWSEYQSDVDGGVTTFTSTPIPETIYSISTSHSETIDVPASAFSAESSVDGTYTADVADKLTNDITSIESVEMRPAGDFDAGEMVPMTLAGDDVEILEIRDEDGSEMSSTTTDEPYTPQSHDNYVTEEEWKDMQAKIEQLTKKYEEEKESGGAGAILPNSGIPDWVVAAGAGAGGILALLGLSGAGGS